MQARTDQDFSGRPGGRQSLTGTAVRKLNFPGGPDHSAVALVPRAADVNVA
jgi:hypothetical protein